MKKLINSLTLLHKKQQGMMLISVILLLALAGVIIGPLMGFMNTGLKVTQAQEVQTELLYAADAGVEDALDKIQDIGTPPSSYTLSENINGMSVGVNVAKLDSDTFKVISTATNPRTGRNTIIESTLDILDLTMFTSGALTSPTSVNIQNNSYVTGDIWTPGFDSSQISRVIGTVDQTPVDAWPTTTEASQIAKFYRNQVDTYHPFSATEIDPSEPGQSGPLYVSNGNPAQTFVMKENGTLTGTIYVNGNLYLGDTTKNARLDLNGKAIFVKGDLSTDPKITLVGPGVIIALGEIVFQPMLESSAYIYVMSVDEFVNFQPLSNFTGSVAGKTQVDIQPGCNLGYPVGGPPSTLNLPGLGANMIAEIKTWIIK